MMALNRRKTSWKEVVQWMWDEGQPDNRGWWEGIMVWIHCECIQRWLIKNLRTTAE